MKLDAATKEANALELRIFKDLLERLGNEELIHLITSLAVTTVSENSELRFNSAHLYDEKWNMAAQEAVKRMSTKELFGEKGKSDE